MEAERILNKVEEAKERGGKQILKESLLRIKTRLKKKKKKFIRTNQEVIKPKLLLKKVLGKRKGKVKKRKRTGLKLKDQELNF